VTSGVNICAYNVAPHHSRELCVPSRLISVSISMSRKGDRMDAVRVQLKNKYTSDVHVCARSDHMIKDTIQTHLRVVKNQRFSIDASERATESHGFAAVWGSRLLRSWTREFCIPFAYVGLHRLCNVKAYRYFWSVDRP
jgi:hypothetical protein